MKYGVESAEKGEKTMKKAIKLLAFVVLAGVFLYSAWQLGSYYLTGFQQEKTVGTLRDQLEEEDPYAINADGILVRYADLYAQNQDMVGWLTIADTPIDYPVMQRKEDPEYYLHRDFNGGDASAGCLFLDGNCDLERPSDNLIVYGHHMKNGNMFGGLQNYEDAAFYNAHKTFVFDTVREHREYQVLSVFRGQVYGERDTEHFHYYDFIDAENAADFDAFVEQVTSLSQHQTGVTAEYGDELLTLSTCAYHKEAGRFVVVAKRLT